MIKLISGILQVLACEASNVSLLAFLYINEICTKHLQIFGGKLYNLAIILLLFKFDNMVLCKLGLTITDRVLHRLLTNQLPIINWLPLARFKKLKSPIILKTELTNLFNKNQNISRIGVERPGCLDSKVCAKLSIICMLACMWPSIDKNFCQ